MIESYFSLRYRIAPDGSMTRLAPAAIALLAALLLTAISACADRPGAGPGAGDEAHLPRVWLAPVTGIETVLIRPGSFDMGSPPDESMREDQELRHRVTLTRPFYLGRYEVTQGQWSAVMGDRPSQFADCGDDCPVENVNGWDIDRFLARLGELEGERFRLPTEAEWEYSCRAGGTAAFGNAASIHTDQANYDGNYAYPHPGGPLGVFRARPTPAGSFAPNAWGLYDMHGNVWEWVADLHCPYPEDAAIDPLASCDTEIRVIRGGSWVFGADSTRCALRYTHHPDDLGPSLGFRVLREVPS